MGSANDPRDIPALATLRVSDALGADVAWALNDAARMLAIQFTVQLLMYFNDPRCDTFFSLDFVLLSLYIVLGVMVYWLILRQLVRIV